MYGGVQVVGEIRSCLAFIGAEMSCHVTGIKIDRDLVSMRIFV